MNTAAVDRGAPVAFHFLFAPHSPEPDGVLVDTSGMPVLTDYQAVDWKALAVSARAAIDDVAPKSIQLFVADDAADVFEVLNLCPWTVSSHVGKGDFFSRFKTAVDKLEMTDMRAGITSLSRHASDYHVNLPSEGRRPPLGGVIISVKFPNASHVGDYLHNVTRALFGQYLLGDKGPALGAGDMSPVLWAWLENQFGVAYGRRCDSYFVGTTRPRPK